MSEREPLALTDEAVLTEFILRLIRIAERNIFPVLRKRVSSEDMAQSAIASFLRMGQVDSLKVSRSNLEDFWPFIVTILLCKIRKRARFEYAAKRDIRREQALDNDRCLMAEIIAEIEPEADYAGACIANLLERLREELSPDSQMVLDGKLQGLQRFQIAEQLDGGKGMSTKTVTRLWKEIQRRARRIADELQD